MRKLMEAVQNLTEHGSEYGFETYDEPMYGPSYDPSYRELIDDLANTVQEQCDRGEKYDKAFKYVLMGYLSSNMMFDSRDVKRDLKFITKDCNSLDNVENDFDESTEIIGEDENEDRRRHEIAEELMGIKEEIKDLIRNAEIMLRGTSEYNSAKSYWIPHILMALDSDHDYLGGSMNSIEDTITALSADSRHFDDMSD